MVYTKAYVHSVRVDLPKEVWDEAWFSLQSWKGALQAVPGFFGMEISARPLEDDEHVQVQIASYWQEPEELEEWLKSGWTPEKILSELTKPPTRIEAAVFEMFE